MCRNSACFDVKTVNLREWVLAAVILVCLTILGTVDDTWVNKKAMTRVFGVE